MPRGQRSPHRSVTGPGEGRTQGQGSGEGGGRGRLPFQALGPSTGGEGSTSKSKKTFSSFGNQDSEGASIHPPSGLVPSPPSGPSLCLALSHHLVLAGFQLREQAPAQVNLSKYCTQLNKLGMNEHLRQRVM